MKNNTMDEKTILVFQELKKALNRLEEVIQEPTHGKRFVIDSAIQRFEFSIELFKKFLKILLFNHGEINVNTPKEIFQEAYAAQFIDNEEAWVSMLKDRNKTSHAYHEDLADEIYIRIPNHFTVMQKTYNKLAQKFNL